MTGIILTEIHIYPVKSCRGISLLASKVEPRGLYNDRRWMIVDEEGMFLSQRTEPRMALIEVHARNKEVSLTCPSAPSVTVSPSESQSKKNVQVWNDQVLGMDQGNEVAQVLSNFLHQAVRLVSLPETSIRKVNPHYGKPQDEMSFADSFPVLVISQASLDDLNGRLDKPVPMNRFRPNLVVTGCEPFAEDHWKHIEIDGVVFEGVRDAARCSVPMVDQANGISGQEPMKTLATYRKRAGQIYVGRHLIPRKTGMIRVGASVRVPS